MEFQKSRNTQLIAYKYGIEMYRNNYDDWKELVGHTPIKYVKSSLSFPSSQ